MLKGVHDKYVTLVIRSRTNKQDVPNLDGHTQGTLGCVIAGNSSNGGGGSSGGDCGDYADCVRSDCTGCGCVDSSWV